jgi:hypothetical protein
MPVPSTEVMRLLAEADWQDLVPRSLAFTSYSLVHHRIPLGYRGKTAQEYVLRAVFELISGKHALHKRSLFNVLAAVIHATVKSDADRLSRQRGRLGLSRAQGTPSNANRADSNRASCNQSNNP